MPYVINYTQLKHIYLLAPIYCTQCAITISQFLINKLHLNFTKVKLQPTGWARVRSRHATDGRTGRQTHTPSLLSGGIIILSLRNTAKLITTTPQRWWRFTTVKQLKRAIITEWGKLSQCFNDRAIINEWRHRLECVVQQQGRQTEHCFCVNDESVQFCVFSISTVYLFVCWNIANTFSWCSFLGHPVCCGRVVMASLLVCKTKSNYKHYIIIFISEMNLF